MPGGSSRDLTRIRALGNRLLVWAVNLLYGARFTELCYGYMALRRSVVARLGLSASIITRGVAAEIESLLEPYRSELELVVLPSTRTTVLETLGQGTRRTQRLLSWAGPIGEGVDVDTAILHLAPVARETGPRWRGHAGFVGLTPQGLVRAWASEGALITRVPLQERLLPQRCNAIVISEKNATAMR